METRRADKTEIMNPLTGPDPADQDSEVGGRDRQSDDVEVLEIYILACFTVQR